MNKLYVIDGPIKGESFTLNDGITTIGTSSDNDICISDIGASRHHAKVIKKGDRIFVSDTSSFQGVFIDGEQIDKGKEAEIKKESTLMIGNSVLSFQKGSPGKTVAQPLPESLERRAKDSSGSYIRSLELLLKVSNILAQSLNINELLEEVISQIFNLLKRINRGAILLLDRETGELQEVVSKTRMDDKTGLSGKFNYSRSIVSRTIKEGNPIKMSNTGQVSKTDLSDSIELMNVMSVMCVPLIYKGEVQGVIYVDSIGLPNGFREDDLQLLMGLSNTAAIAIENARLYDEVKQELTERQKTEVTLRESEEKYRTILESIGEGYFEVDFTGNLAFFNNSFCRIMGYSQGELLSMNNRDYTTPETAKRMYRIFNEIYRTGKPAEITDYEVIKKDGSVRTLEMSAYLMRDSDGKPIGFRGVARDVTERKLAEDQLRTTYQELQDTKDMLVQSEKLAAIGRLTAGVAHEILNPVNIISMRLQLLDLKEGVPEKIAKDLSICKSQLTRVISIINDLRQFSRITEKNVTLNDLNKIIEHVVTLNAPQLKEDGIATEIQYQPGLPMMPFDKDRIQQVIFNIISNAIAAMAGQETKVLRIVTELTDSEDYVSLIFSDTGPGIDMSDMSKIFDPFFTTKDSIQGTGLGLSISYSIIQDHGGKIWAESNEWGGASFFVELPLESMMN